MKISRFKTGDSGTFGRWYDDDNTILCFTVERPYIGDHPCINKGTYSFHSYNSPTKGDVWLRDDAAANDGRVAVEIHAANWARQLLGCIAVGEEVKIIDGTEGVTNSKATLAMLKKKLPDEFYLTIEEDFE